MSKDPPWTGWKEKGNDQAFEAFLEHLEELRRQREKREAEQGIDPDSPTVTGFGTID